MQYFWVNNASRDDLIYIDLNVSCHKLRQKKKSLMYYLIALATAK